MANIFISHSTIDGELANFLCESFEARGLSCWIAPRNIMPGAEWATSITNAINEANVFFVLYSKNSIKSSQVTKEIGIADRKGKYMLPYKIDDTEPEGAFDYYLTGCQWVIVDPSSGDYKIDELCEIIRKIVKQNGATRTAENNNVTQPVAPEKKENKIIHHITPTVAEVNQRPIQPVVEQRSAQQSAQPVVTQRPVQQPAQSVMTQRPVQQPAQSVVTQRPVQQPAQPAVAQRPTQQPVQTVAAQQVQQPVLKVVQPTKTKKNSVAMKERRRLLVGGGIVLGLLVCVIVAAVMLIGGLNKDGDSPSLSGDGIFSNFQATSAKDFDYQEVDGHIVITGYNGTNTEIVIPAEIDGKTVSMIGDKAFYGCGNLTSVEIPDTVGSISSYAFYKCSGLISVIIPNSVAYIGEHAFEECTSLTQIRLPDSVVTIDSFAFNKCTALTNIRMSMSVEEIGSYAFATCEKLEMVTLPDTLKTIGDMSFAYCTSMGEITIPDGVESVSPTTFSGCNTIIVYYKGGSYNNDISGITDQL